MTSMITGSAPDAATFLSTLTTFLTTDATLVAAGENWSSVWTEGSGPHAGDFVLKGPGLAGTDNIYVGFRLFSDAVANKYILWMNGVQSLLTGSAIGIEGHANTSPLVGLYLDSAPFEYWIVASGRRFAITLQVGGTVFESAYCGYFLPYAAPTQYPVPLFIGGSRGVRISGLDTVRSADAYHTNYASPARDAAYDSGCFLMTPEGTWLPGATIAGGWNDAFMVGPNVMGDGLGSQIFNNTGALGYQTNLSRVAHTFDGGYALMPLTLVQEHPTSRTFGVLDGVYRVPGNGNASGNIITISGNDHLVVQNVFRTDPLDYIALKLV